MVSDMNGFGHFGTALFWFRLYWLAFGGVLTYIGFLFWKRGTDSGRKARLQIAKGQIKYSNFIYYGTVGGYLAGIRGIYKLQYQNFE